MVKEVIKRRVRKRKPKTLNPLTMAIEVVAKHVMEMPFLTEKVFALTIIFQSIKAILFVKVAEVSYL